MKIVDFLEENKMEITNLDRGHYQGQVKVNMNFLNITTHCLLHILIAHLESFPKHYNKIIFHEILFEL